MATTYERMTTESDIEGYSELPVPSDLIQNIGYIIGKDGYYFKKITEASGVSFIWFNKTTQKIEICCTDTPYDHAHNDFFYPDDIVGTTPEIVDEVLVENVEECIQNAKDRILDRFIRCRNELGSMPRMITLADYMKDI
jgi:hypothetical protein